MPAFSVWEGDSVTLVRGAGPPIFADGTPQDPAAVKVLEFRASSWEDACRRVNDRYGRGPYDPGESPAWEAAAPRP